jgi:hypothetical protein
MNGRRAQFLPAPAEIAAATARIRDRWSEREFRKRSGEDPDTFSRWTVPTVTVVQDANDVDFFPLAALFDS